jgi:hypothetical protein
MDPTRKTILMTKSDEICYNSGAESLGHRACSTFSYRDSVVLIDMISR